MDGLWAFVLGGLAMTVLMASLESAYHWSPYVGMPAEECTNYLGNGNAGPLSYTGWDYLLPFVAVGWVVLVGVELALVFAAPPRSGRTRRAVLGTIALVLSAVLAVWLPINVALICG
jgi:hypothetical protein